MTIAESTGRPTLIFLGGDVMRIVCPDVTAEMRQSLSPELEEKLQQLGSSFFLVCLWA